MGTLGESILIRKEDLPLAVSRGFAILTFKDYINPNYVLCYTKTDSFLKQLEKNKVGSVQKGVYLNSIKNIKIPIFPIDVQNKIVDNYRNKIIKAQQLEEEAKKLLEQAKKQLEEMILSSN